jgi:hypothetical protein
MEHNQMNFGYKVSPFGRAIRLVRGAASRGLVAALICSALPYILWAQGRSVVCDNGDGQFQVQFSTGVGVYVGPSTRGDLESRSCDATLSWQKKTIFVANGAPQADIDALGADLGFGQPVVAFQIKNPESHGRMTYEIYSLQKAPRLLRKITGGAFYRSADTDMDGRVEIWTGDVAAIEGFDALPLGDFEFAPTVVLRFEHGRLMDVSAEFQPEYDEQIAKVRGELSAGDLRDFKASDGKTPTAPSLSESRLNQLKLTKARVLEIVWAYLYSGREQEAWQALSEMWPAEDTARARSAISAAWAHGMRTQLDGTITDGAKDKTKDVAFVYDTPNSVQESVISPAMQSSRAPETAPAETKTQTNPVSDTTPTAILLHIRVANGQEPTFPAGGAVLDLVIDSAGKVERARPIGDVDPAVLLASKEWTFIPAFKNGRAVASRMRMAVSLGQ